MSQILATTPKVDLPFHNKRERKSTLCLVRTMPHTVTHAHTAPIIQEGPSTGPACAGVLPRLVVKQRPRRISIFGLGVDRLETLLRIDESLAFRAFHKTIIYGHWLSKTQKLALASGAFLLKKAFYYILVDYFQKYKKYFSKKSFSEKEALKYFYMGLYCFPHMLYSFPSCANIG